MKLLSPSGSENLGAAIAMLVIGALAVILRFIFRISAKQSLMISDGLIGLSLAFMAVYSASIINCKSGPYFLCIQN